MQISAKADYAVRAVLCLAAHARVHLRDVWIAVRSSLREVLDETTVADVLTGELPAHVRALVEAPGAGQRS